MAKKILAVVLAVTVALSAMAISVFAEDVKIPVYPTSKTNPFNSAGGVTTNTSYDTTTVAVTFDVPLYALYGYMDSDHYMVFTLPTNFGSNADSYYSYDGDNIKFVTDANGSPELDDKGNKKPVINSSVATINWSLIVNGVEYVLEQTTGKTKLANPRFDASLKNKEYSEHKVNFGYATHPYMAGFDTTIPQSTGYGDTTSVRLVANVTVSGYYSDWKVDISAFTQSWQEVYRTANVQFYNAKDDTPVTGSRSFIWQWTPTKGDKTVDNHPGKYTFVTSDWTTQYLQQYDAATGTWVNLDPTNTSEVPLTWDHTLQNQSYIYGSPSDTVKLVVELDNALNGQATYTLWASTDANRGTNWWQYSGARQYVSEVRIDGTQESLEFDVPISTLIEPNYGTFNQEFVIFENITLMDYRFMKNPLKFQSAWGNNSSALNLSAMGSGNLGRLSWGWSDVVNFDGAPLRYAAGGASEEYRTSNDGTAAPAKATAMYLLIPGEEEPDAAEKVDSPVEGGSNETEGEEVDAPADETETAAPAPAEDNNPTTGIALAVVPMLVAAAAAVVAKKH